MDPHEFIEPRIIEGFKKMVKNLRKANEDYYKKMEEILNQRS